MFSRMMVFDWSRAAAKIRRLVCPLPIVHVSLVQEIISRTMFPCTSLADLADYPPDSGRLEQETPARYAFWCTSETCTSRHHLEASKRTSTNKLQFIGLSPTPARRIMPPCPIHSRAGIMKYPRAFRIQGAVGIVVIIV